MQPRLMRTLRAVAMAAGLLGTVLPALAGTAPQLRLQMQTPPHFDTGNLGGNSDGSIGIGLILLNGQTANAPLTVRLTLPAHVTHIGHQGASWSCTSSPSEVICQYANDLTFAMWSSSSLGVLVNVDPALPVPGNSVVRATLESAQLPLPDPLQCASGTGGDTPWSDTQCLEQIVPHRQSFIDVVPATWAHHPGVLEAGATGAVSVAFQNIGFGELNGTVTARFLLPPGVTFSHASGQVTWNCSGQPPDASGQLLTCTTAYFFDGMGPSQANITLNLLLAEDVETPGPLPLFATISNAAQPPPEFHLCDDPSPPVGCGFYTFPTHPPRLSRMDIVDVLQQPGEFRLGEDARVRIDYTNIGEGSAAGATVSVALPPGYAYISQTASPPLSCAVTAGTPASGQTMDCVHAGAYPPGVAGFVSLLLEVLPAAATQAQLVASSSDNGRPGPTLAECIADAANPQPLLGCGRATLLLSPWLFCDGLEALHRTCGLPQAF